MHELPVTQSILDIAVRHASQAGAQRIIEINLTIGQLSTIVDDSVCFYWDMIASGTIAEGARLKFKRIPAELECLSCGTIYQPGADADDFACPECASIQIKVIGGREFFVESIDVE